ncbi:DUF4412 domain-containing protein [Fontibacter flavus]|uniref:DUF4412 domain-containing protein n=1 Tax=Fontibacter flavus TaxID=654838 RepID=A0ABV6FP85_9BACT
MKKLIILLSLIFINLPFQAHSQLMRKLKQAAERGVSNAIEKKVESETEKIAQRQLEKVFTGIYGPEGLPGMDMGKILEGISADVPVADAYHFTGFSIMEFTGKDEKGKIQEPTNIKTFFSDNQSTLGMEIENKDKKSNESDPIIIYDLERNASIILFENEGKKTRMAYGLDLNKIAEGVELDDAESEDDELPKFRKTNNTKTILGYLCEEYEVEDEEGKASYWFTEKPIQSRSLFWGASNPFLSAKMKNQPMESFKNMPQGNLMEMHYTSLKDKSEILMTILAINENHPQTLEMAEYQNAFAGMQEK